MMTTLFSFQTFFVGLWPIVKANLGLVGLVAGCVLFALYSPRFKIVGLIAAVAIGASLISYNTGVKHEYDRMEAQRVAREEQFNKELKEARRKAVATVARRTAGTSGGWLRGKAAVDRYDRNP